MYDNLKKVMFSMTWSRIYILDFTFTTVQNLQGEFSPPSGENSLLLLQLLKMAGNSMPGESD